MKLLAEPPQQGEDPLEKALAEIRGQKPAAPPAMDALDSALADIRRQPFTAEEPPVMPTRQVAPKSAPAPIAAQQSAATPKPLRWGTPLPKPDAAPAGPYADETLRTVFNVAPGAQAPAMAPADAVAPAVPNPQARQLTGVPKFASDVFSAYADMFANPAGAMKDIAFAVPNAVTTLTDAYLVTAGKAPLDAMPSTKDVLIAAAQLGALGVAGPLERLVGKELAQVLTKRAAAKGLASTAGLDRAAAVISHAIGAMPAGAAFNPDHPGVGAAVGAIAGGTIAGASGARVTLGESPYSLSGIRDLLRKADEEASASSGPASGGPSGPAAPTGGAPSQIVMGSGGGGGASAPSGPPRTLPTSGGAKPSLALEIAGEAVPRPKGILDQVLDATEPTARRRASINDLIATRDAAQTAYKDFYARGMASSPAGQTAFGKYNTAQAQLDAALAAQRPKESQAPARTLTDAEKKALFQRAKEEMDRMSFGGTVARIRKPGEKSPAPVETKPEPAPVAAPSPREYIPKTIDRVLTEAQHATRNIADQLARAHPDAIAHAAPEMAKRIPPGAVLMPMPDKAGDVTANKQLAEAIAELVPGVTLKGAAPFKGNAPVVAIDGIDTGQQAPPNTQLVTFAKAPLASKEVEKTEEPTTTGATKQPVDGTTKAADAPKYDYSSTQFDLPPETATKIKSLGTAIPDADLAADGREAAPHITVKYGLHGNEPEKVRELLKDEPPITVTLGKTSFFPNGESGAGDVLKVDVDSPALHALNKKIADALPHTDTHPEYQPHATIAYVKPGLGKKYEGDESLVGQTITLNSLTFSGTDGKTVEIPLAGNAEATRPTGYDAHNSKSLLQIRRALLEHPNPTGVAERVAEIDAILEKRGEPAPKTPKSEKKPVTPQIPTPPGGHVLPSFVGKPHAKKEEAPSETKPQPAKLKKPGVPEKAPLAGQLTQYDTPKVLEARRYTAEHGETYTINTPERDALRHLNADGLYGDGAAKKEKVFTLWIGLPASGKSTLAEQDAKGTGSLLLDTDDAKKELTEYADGLGTSVVHREGTMIRNIARDRAIAAGDNIVIPTVGHDTEGLLAEISKLAAAGWTVHLRYVELDPHKAAERAVKRFEAGGIFVDPAYILEIGEMPGRTFERLKNHPGIATYERYDSDTPKGVPARLVEAGGQNTDRGGSRSALEGDGGLVEQGITAKPRGVSGQGARPEADEVSNAQGAADGGTGGQIRPDVSGQPAGERASDVRPLARLRGIGSERAGSRGAGAAPVAESPRATASAAPGPVKLRRPGDARVEPGEHGARAGDGGSPRPESRRVDATVSHRVSGDTHIIEATIENGDVVGRGRFVVVNDELRYEPGGILYVEPAYRRRGIATAIVRKAEDVTGRTLKDAPVTTGEGRAFLDSFIAPENFVIPKEGLDLARGAVARAKDNVAAIKLLKSIEAEHRAPTKAEQATLAKYVGWGGIAGYLDEGTKLYDSPLGHEIREVLTDEEFKAAAASTPNAHYTSVDVARAMHRALAQLGFTKGRILEPSMGSGVFLGTAPTTYRWTGVELDSITGRIGALLYPKADIRVQGFEKTKVADGFFDAAIGNVPFGDYQVADPRYDKLKLSIHNYFFAKSLDVVRPGGVIAYVTSAFTLDAKSSLFREYVSEKADFLGAIRLPNTAFKGNAGTDVTTDIIFLKVRAPGDEQGGVPWKGLKPVATGDNRTVNVNEYFAQHPDMMLGTPSLAGTMYASESFALAPHHGVPLSDALARAIARLPKDVYVAAKIESPASRSKELPGATELARAPDDMQDGAFVIINGKLRQVRDGLFDEPAVPSTRAATVRSLTEIKEATKVLLAAEVADEPVEVLDAKRKVVNKLYDAFVKANGAINLEQRTETKRVDKEGNPIVTYRYPNLASFTDDPEFPWVTMLEDYDAESGKATKADILSRRVMQPRKAPDRVATPSLAIPVVLAEDGKLDVDRVAQLSGSTPEQVVEALNGSVMFYDPFAKQWQTADAYLSGDVKSKLFVAQEAAKQDAKYQINVDALAKAQPEDIPPSQIGANLGAPWIPKQDILDFVQDLLKVGAPDMRYVKVHHVPTLATWKLEAPNWIHANFESRNTWGNAKVSAIDLIDDALNQKQTELTKPDPQPGRPDHRTKDIDATLAAQEKQQAIKDRFRSWLWEDGVRATRLSKLYNEKMNRIRLPKPDGSHLTLPGAASHVKGRPFALRPHQMNAVWRILAYGNTLLAHVVGSGKTYTMVAAGMEAKRLGLARKPLYVVPNHMLAQFRDEFKGLYPMARLLVATKEDFGGDARREFVGRAATHDWDAIIMTHRSFEAVGMSPEFQEQYIDRQIDELESAIRDAKAGKSDRSLVKMIEKAKKRLEAKLERLMSADKKDKFLSFEQMGADMLFVDEAHYGKNLAFHTQMRGVAVPSSGRAFDLFLKTQYLHKINPGRGIVFATGTPISNALSEMFTLQRYLQPDLMRERGVENFDSWAASFAEPVTKLELAPDGSGARVKTRLAKYNNLGELAQMFRLVTDVQSTEDLKLPRPDLATGKMQVVAAPATPDLKLFVQGLVKRAKAVRDKKVDPDEDNFLKITTAGRNAAMDMRLVSHTTDNPKGKLNLAVAKIAEIYKRTTPLKGAQLVFSDLSTPGSDPSAKLGGVADWNAYDEIKQKLVAAGVPAKEVRFMHDADSDEKKRKMFADVRAGRVRVLLGSTEKMGAGTNAQDRLVALHHLDAPWRPSDVEQRNGRILRQGNLLFNDGKIPHVEIYAYVTEGSFDAYIWQTLERKADFIQQALKAGPGVRSLDDDGDVEIDFATAKAIASGNPKVMEKAQVDADVARFERLERAHQDQQVSVRKELVLLPVQIKELEPKIEALRTDLSNVTDTSGDKFVVVIGGTKVTKRADAGEMIRAAVIKVGTEAVRDKGVEKMTRIGTFAGLELHATARTSGVTGLTNAYIALKGEDVNFREVHENDSPTSIVSGLEHMPGVMKTTVESMESSLARHRAKLAALTEAGVKAFEHKDQLTELRARATTLGKELEADAVKAEEEATADPTTSMREKLLGDGDGSTTLYAAADPITAAFLMAKELKKLADRRRKEGREPLVTSTIADVEERLRAAEKGVDRPRFRDEAKSALDAAKKLTRHFPEINPSRSTLEATVNEILLEHERAPKWAQAKAYNELARITEGLAPNEVNLMTRFLALQDIQKDVQRGLYNGRSELPFGYANQTALEADIAAVKSELLKHPNVRDAIQRRQAFVKDLTEEMVALDLLPPETLKDDRYYHRQVMSKVQPDTSDRAPTVVGRAKDVRQRERGFQKGRTGGSDFNLRYEQAEFEWVAQALTEAKTALTLQQLKRLTDLTGPLKAQAKGVNQIRLGEILAEQAEAPIAEAEELADAALKPYRQRIARAITGILKAIVSGDADVKGFDGVIDAIATAYNEWKDEMADLDPADRTPFPLKHRAWWPLVKALADSEGLGSKWARSLLKALSERERFIEDTLGREFINPRDPESLAELAPEGYTTWPLEEGNHFFRAQGIEAKAVEALLNGDRSLTKDDLKSMLVMGGAKETWIIPDWLAATLTNFGVQPRVPGPLGAIDRGMTRMTSLWKQYILHAPTRFLKYNMNNMSGDADAALAYGPGIFRKVPGAARDLWHYTFKRTAPKGETRRQLDTEMERMVELGVIDAGLTATEIPDVTDLPAFRRLAESDPLNFMALVGKYSRAARTITQYRENILRLAAFRYFEERVNRGHVMYAASDPARVRAEASGEKRAALLSRDLIGDYGNTSAFTQFVRQRMLPFFSFQEVNFKRYVWLMRNIPLEAREGGGGRGGRGGGGGRGGKGGLGGGDGSGGIGGPIARIGAIGAVKATRQGVKFLVLANLFFLAVAAWNAAMFPDEEEELRRKGRGGLHLILGRNDDGSIRTLRVEGAWSDFLEWLNLHDYPEDVRDLVSGGADLSDKPIDALKGPVNKIVGLWDPFTKGLFEQLTKRSLYPDPFRPTPIRDRGEHAARMLALDGLYRTVTGRPAPKGNPVVRMFVYRTDPGEAAYFDIKARTAKYLDEQGKPRTGGDPTERSNALYYWKRAIQWGDEQAAAKWLAEYHKLGGTTRGLRQSMALAEPLAGMSARDRRDFERSLSNEGKQILRMADEWYNRVYRGARRTRLPRLARPPQPAVATP